MDGVSELKCGIHIKCHDNTKYSKITEHGGSCHSSTQPNKVHDLWPDMSLSMISVNGLFIAKLVNYSA